MKIKENSPAGRAICAISNWGIRSDNDRVCAATAWIVWKFNEEPELRNAGVVEEEASADLLDALAVNSMTVLNRPGFFD